MNSPDLLTPWLAPLGWLALEATVVVLVALAAQPLFRTAAARRSLWRAALLALVVVLAAELTGTGSQLPAQLRLAWQTAFPKPAPRAEAPPLGPIPNSLSPIPHPPSPIPSFEFVPEPLPPAHLPAFPPAHFPTLPPAPTPAWPAAVWLAGLAALLARSAWTHAGFAWLRLRHFIPAAEALRERVQALAARLGLRRRVRVLASERLRTPAAFGWLRPGVGVPGDFTARFAPAQQDVMLAHELAHLAARDPLWQLLADLVTAALWWHPLAWVARRQHRLAGELAADDASLALPNGPVVLAECLLTLGHEAADCPRAALGMAGFRSQLGRRIERLLALPRRDWQAPSRARLALQTGVALLALAALALLPGCAANRTAGEAPSGIVVKWWQAKTKTPENQPRGATLLNHAKPQPKPVLIHGRVVFNGTPPTEREMQLPPPVVVSLVARAKEFDQQRKVMVADLQRALDEYKQLLESVSDSNTDVQERERRKQAAEAKLRELQKLEATIIEFDRTARTQLGAQRTNTLLTSRFHRVAPDGGLADVLVYVKYGLTNQTFTAPTNTHLIRIQRYEYQPYITAVQTGQPIRWETDVNLNFHPTPTNAANREFNRVLEPARPVEAVFTAPEFFLRTKDDVHPWLFGYVSVLPHPFFAVTDAEGRFRFPQPLPPGKYTLAALHRRAGENAQEINLTQPLPAGQPLDVQFQLGAKEVSVAAPALPGPFTNKTAKSLTLRSYTPTASLTREELLEHKSRVEAEIKEAEKLYKPSHPRMIGLRKQLESVNEALKQAVSSVTNAIDISVGRQLFVDDFLIASSSVERAWHKPAVFADTPLVKLPAVLTPPGPPAVCDRVWYDPTNQLFKLRFATSNGVVAVFNSANGTNWVRGETNATDPALRIPLSGPMGGYATRYESIGFNLHDSVLYSGFWANFSRRSEAGRTAQLLGEGPFIPAPAVPVGAKWEQTYPALDAFLVVGRNLYFYFGGQMTLPGDTAAHPAVGLATLRRDGFASLDAGPEGGVLTTKPVTFTGRFLFVNLKTNAPDGEMRIEILHPDGRPIVVTKNDTKQQSQPFSRANAMPLAGDQTLLGVSWQNGVQDLAMLVGRPVRFRFHLKSASLYSFWVGPGQLGRSMGRVAGGGPHFTNDVDTIGNRSYQAFPVVRTNTSAPKPGASLQPAPVAANVRRLTSPAAVSQRLVTSSPTDAGGALGQTRPTSPDTAHLKVLAGRLVQAQTDATKLRFDKGAQHPDTHANRLLLAALEQAIDDEKKFLAFLANAQPSNPDVETTFVIATLSRRHQALLEARIELASKAGDLGPLHPEAKRLKAVMDELTQQVEHGKQKLQQASPPKPGASLQPTPVAADVRKLTSPQTPDAKPQTPPASQSLLTSAATPVQLAAASPKGLTLPVPNPYFRTNAERPFLTHSSKGAQLINRKLDQIVLPEIHFDGVPLKDVVKRLADDAKQFDPEKKGLNFLINDVNRTALTVAPALDPSGNPIPAAQPVPWSETLVHLSLPLKGLTLREALDAICKTSEGGAGFSVEEYAVAFIPRGPGASALFSRTFRVSPDPFMQGLQGVVASPVLGVQAGQPTTANGAAGQPAAAAGGVGAAGPVRAVVPPAVPAMQNNANSANALIRQFFQSVGVSGLGVTNSGTRVQFNPQTGALVVQGTASDLRAVEQALGKLGVNPPPAP